MEPSTSPLSVKRRCPGKTATEVQRDLSSRLGAKYLQNPQVQVRVKEFNSNRVTVSGAVKSPGVFPYKGETLFQCRHYGWRIGAGVEFDGTCLENNKWQALCCEI